MADLEKDEPAIQAFLLGLLRGFCQGRLNSYLRVESVDHHVVDGTYQEYFTVTFKSGIRLRVSVRPDRPVVPLQRDRRAKP